MGAQGSIIGPTHAISAALTSLKGAARRVRKASSSSSRHRNIGDTGNGTGSSGRGGLNGAIRADAIEEEDEEEDEEEEDDSGNGDDGGRKGSATAVEADAAVGGEGGRAPGDVAVGGYDGDSAAVEAGAAMRDGGGAAAEFGEWTGSVFGQEAGRYNDMLEAMVRGAVEVRT